MAVVRPVTDTTQTLNPDSGARLQPSEFSGGQMVARGAQALAAGTKDVADEIARLEMREQEQINRAARVAAERERQDFLLNPESGYLNTQREDAVRNLPTARAGLEAILNRHRPQGRLAGEMYDQFRETQMLADSERMLQHASGQYRQVETDTYNAAQLVRADSAIANWARPEFALDAAVAFEEARTRADRLGLEGPAASAFVQDEYGKFTERVVDHVRRLSRTQQGGPGVAKAFLEAQIAAGRVSETLADDLLTRLAPEAVRETALARASHILQYRNPATGNTAPRGPTAAGGTPTGPVPSMDDVLASLNTQMSGPRSGHRTPEQNRQVGGARRSDHLTDNARDIPLRDNAGRPLTKERLRTAYEEAGYHVRLVLGPGDPGHSDHFHVSAYPPGHPRHPGARGAAPVAGAAPARAADPGSTVGRVQATGVPAQIAATLRTTPIAGRNMPEHVIAGVLGNGEVESGWDRSGSGDGGTAHGYFQWRGERVTNFQREIGKHPRDASPEETARFFAWEMNNPRAAGMSVAQRDAILNAGTAGEAAALIDQHYERSNGAHRDRRVAAAERYARGVTPGQTDVNMAPMPAPEQEVDLEATLLYIANNPDYNQIEREELSQAVQQLHGMREGTARARQQALQDRVDREVTALGDGFESITQLSTETQRMLERDPGMLRTETARAAANRERRENEERRQAEAAAQLRVMQERDTQVAVYQQLHFLAATGDPQFLRFDLNSVTGLTLPERERLVRMQRTAQQGGSNSVPGLNEIFDRMATEAGSPFSAPRGRSRTPSQNDLRVITQSYATELARTRAQQLGRDLRPDELGQVVRDAVRDAPAQAALRGAATLLPGGESILGGLDVGRGAVGTRGNDSFTPAPANIVPPLEQRAIVRDYRANNRGATPDPQEIIRIYQQARR